MEPKKTKTELPNTTKGNANRDAITGEPGAHPIGVGAGAAGGGIAGAILGVAIGGPIGAGAGAVVGAIGGGMAGDGVAEAINPTTEHEFWRKEHSHRPYFTQGTPYEQYGPAFQYGWESYADCTGKSFEDAESELARGWERHRGASKLSWEHAKRAAHDAWQRVEKAFGKTCCE
jgi:hypothetical protein